ncbi:MAG: translocation/assembly module TamB [Spirochaetes bacterium]|nr:translocation/assembly module TamB [Spirochaetota bacterium]
MAEQTIVKTDEKKPPRKAVFVQVAVFLGLVCLIALSIRPIQSAVNHGMQYVRDRIIAAAEDFVGREILYASIRPTFLGYFDIRDLRVQGEDGYVLSVERLRVTFSLIELLRGRITAVRYIQLDNPIVRLDTARDSDLIELFSSLGNGNGDAAALLPLDMDFKIRGGYISFRDAFVLYEIGNIYLDLSFGYGRVNLDGQAWAGLSLADFLGRSFSLSTRLGLSGQASAAFDEGGATISFSDFYGGESRDSPSFRLNPLGFDLGLDGTLLTLRNADGGNAALNFEFDTEDGSIRAVFSNDAMNLSNFASLLGELQDANRWLDQIIAGYAEFESSGGQMRYSVNIASAGATAADGGLGDSFGIRASGDENMIVIHELYVSSAPAAPSLLASLDIIYGVVNGGSAPAAGGRPRLFEGAAAFSGSIGFAPLIPNGTITFEQFSVGGQGGINARLDLASDGDGIYLYANTVAFGESEIDRFNASFKRQENGLSAVLSAALPPVILPQGTVGGGETVTLEAFVDFEPFALSGRLELDSFSAAAVTRLPIPFVQNGNIPAFAAGHIYDALISTELFFSTDFNNISYNTANLLISSKSNGAFGQFALSGTNESFLLSEGRLELGGETLILQAAADYSNLQDVGFSIGASLGELSWFFDGRFLDGQTLSVNGLHGLNIFVSPQEEGGFSGFVEVIDFPLPLNGAGAANGIANGHYEQADYVRADYYGQGVYLSLYAYFRFESVQDWDLDLEFLSLAGIPGPAGTLSLYASGRADQSGASFPAFSYSDGHSPLAGRADLSWEEGFSSLWGLVLLSGGEDAAESYIIEASVQDGRLELMAIARGMVFERFVSEGALAGALADGQVLLSLNGADYGAAAGGRRFEAEISIDSLTMPAGDNELGLSALVNINNDELAMRDLHISFAGFETRTPQLLLNRHGILSLAPSSIRGAGADGDAGAGLSGTFSLYASFEPVAAWVYAGDIIGSIEGRLNVVNFQHSMAAEAEPFSFDFSSRDGEISVAGGPRNMLRFHSDSEGVFFAALSSPSPVRGFAIGSISEGYIDASVTDLFVDLEALWSLLPPRPNFALAGGFVSGGFDIIGPLDNPEFFGGARATSLRIQVPNFIPADIRPVPTHLTIYGNEISFGPVGAAVGRGAGIASGLFMFDGWVPYFFTIEIDIAEESPVPYTFAAGNFSVHGYASGLLVLTMDNQNLDVSGDFLANNTEMEFGGDGFAGIGGGGGFLGIGGGDGFLGFGGRNQIEEGPEPQPGRLSNTVNLNIVTGPSVEFFLPNARFPLLRATPVRGTVLHITADSLSGQFSVDSDVRIRSGELFYFERSFYMRGGLLVFRENEQEFNPRLTTRAEIRDRTDDGPVTIAMVVEDEPLLDFSPRFESTPSLSQLEIFMILGHNVFDGEGGTVQDVFLTTTVDMFGHFLFIRRVERYVRNFLNLDMFTIRTQVLSNAILNRQPAAARSVNNNGAPNAGSTGSVGGGTGGTATGGTGGATTAPTAPGGSGSTTAPTAPTATVVTTPIAPRGIGNYLDNTTIFGGRYFADGDIFIQGMVTMRHDELNWGGLLFEPSIGIELAQSPFFSIRWDFMPSRPENWWFSDNAITFTWNRSF